MALGSLGKAWDLQDREADAIEERMKRVLEANAPALLAIYGCGTVTAAALAVAGGGNPERLKSEAEFASLCGVAPLLASSGKKASQLASIMNVYPQVLKNLTFCL